MELILENIEYDILVQNERLDRDRLDELVELMEMCIRDRCRGTLRVYAGNCEGNERTVALLGDDRLAGLDCFLPG